MVMVRSEAVPAKLMPVPAVKVTSVPVLDRRETGEDAPEKERSVVPLPGVIQVMPPADFDGISPLLAAA